MLKHRESTGMKICGKEVEDLHDVINICGEVTRTLTRPIENLYVDDEGQNKIKLSKFTSTQK